MSNRILIIGAGLTGLAVASGLRHRGLEPVLVEQAPIITEAGWAIGLSPRHLVALDRLGITDRAHWPGYRADRNLMFNGATGLVDRIATDGPIMFSRSDLQTALLAGVSDLVRTGVRPRALTDLGDAVEVEFDNGERESFDAVIGADGINSWTRRHVLNGPEATYTGTAAVRFRAPNPHPALTVTALASGGKDATLAYLLMDGGKKFHGVVFLHGPLDNRRDLSPAELADLFPPLAGPLTPVIDILRSNPDSYYANINQAVVDTWTRNRVALAGDAAHAMSPVLGQGAGAGFEDAAMLAELLTTPHLSAPLALASYEQLRKPEAQSLQRLAHETSQAMAQNSSPTAIFTRTANLPGGV
ncbi:MAG TPA: NAD(P)/FAD-dependent oxidoreductase [Pseudonocardiaceae bacterium]|jgi:FAD-dependent urate hydroxylase|nr:NAD(P)/FAD-dependent oxidoreductase [Pseudonocardiaceae bacterium]